MPKGRRGPGTGHLFVRRDAAGREAWYGKWYVDERHQAKRRIGPKRGPDGRGLDRRAAERKLRKLIEDVAAPPDSRVSVSVAGERLIEHLEALGRKRSTVESYAALLHVHLVPYFGERALDGVAAVDVEAFMSARARDGSSPKTIRNAVTLLSSIFEHARRKGWATSNPCTDVDRPEPTVHADIRFLELEELEAVVRAELELDDHLAPTLAMMYRTAGMTGLRMGELIALRWRDVDWASSRVRVRRSHVRGEFTTPKSRRGSRAVPLGDDLAAELEHHSQRSAFQADDELVFAHPSSGSPFDRSKVRKRFKDALRASDVREVRFHDLRHTFGTRMAGAGVPMRTLQEWMGHASVKTTEIYADYAPSEHEREWVEAAFRRTTGRTRASAPERTENT
jgi:integrase